MTKATNQLKGDDRRATSSIEEPQTTQTFEEMVRPLIKWLAENHNPHCKIIIESNSAELMAGEIGFVTEDYLVD